MATFQKRIDAANNEAWEADDDTGFSANAVVRVDGGPTASGRTNGLFRFESVTIPQGSTINTATITILAVSTNRDDPHLDIYAEDIDDSPDVVTLADVTGTRLTRLTTASVEWDTTGIGTSPVASPDISTVISEVVNRAGWASGNNLSVIMVAKDVSFIDLRCTDFVTDSANAALLDVDYTAPAGGGGSTSPNALRINASRGNLGTNMTTR